MFIILTATISVAVLNILPSRTVSNIVDVGDRHFVHVGYHEEDRIYIQTDRHGVPLYKDTNTFWSLTPRSEYNPDINDISHLTELMAFSSDHGFEAPSYAVPPCRDCMDRTHETFFEWMGCYFERHWQSPMWRLSQVFAFYAFIFSVWSWQMKDKVKCLFLVGMFSWLLVASAALLGNWTLAILFGLAAIRNFVFCYFDWRGRRGKTVARKWYVRFAWVFAISTFGSTILLVHVLPMLDILHTPFFAWWLEWLICITLLGLIIGNILEGTRLMRWSFVFNRVFNIVNHAYFANVIAVVIAVAAILSNLLFFARMAIDSARKKKRGEEVGKY
jgi:hypothetical protein